jgi:hypothetical protein
MLRTVATTALGTAAPDRVEHACGLRPATGRRRRSDEKDDAIIPHSGKVSVRRSGQLVTPSGAWRLLVKGDGGSRLLRGRSPG